MKVYQDGHALITTVIAKDDIQQRDLSRLFHVPEKFWFVRTVENEERWGGWKWNSEISYYDRNPKLSVKGDP